MKKATGETKKIIKKVARIQHLVGQAKGSYWNDRQADRAKTVVDALEEAFNLCVEITGEYDPT